MEARSKDIAGEPLDGEWATIERSLTGEVTHLWNSYWEDSHKNIVIYLLTYQGSSKDASELSDSLEVKAFFLPAGEAIRQGQQFREQLESLKRKWGLPLDR
jgi:hypothetical protein